MTNADIRAIEAHLDVLLERYEQARCEVLEAMCRHLRAIQEGPRSALATAIRIAAGGHCDDLDAEYRARRDALRADIDDLKAISVDYVRNHRINAAVDAYAETLRRFKGSPVTQLISEGLHEATHQMLRDALQSRSEEPPFHERLRDDAREIFGQAGPRAEEMERLRRLRDELDGAA